MRVRRARQAKGVAPGLAVLELFLVTSFVGAGAAMDTVSSNEGTDSSVRDSVPRITSSGMQFTGRTGRKLLRTLPQSFLFMGGLQRSGTTWLESIVASPLVSGLSFDNVDVSTYQQKQPWLLQNHTQEYFEVVVRSGGVEGKFVQGEYPYVYLVRDVGKRAISLDALLLNPRMAAARSAEKLFDQWSLFWDTSKPILLEKTPENFLMAPYLQAAFGAAHTRFTFIMRHPLVWALAIEKWIFVDFVALRTVEDRVAFWFDCMSRAVQQLPELRDALVLQLETASASFELQVAVAQHLLCRSNNNASSDLRAPMPMLGDEGSKEILSSSLAYVVCWLSGMEFKSSLRRCVPRRPFRDPAYRQQPEQLAIETRWRLRQLARQHEAQANHFGYSFKPFLALASTSTGALLQQRIRDGPPAGQVEQLGVTAPTSPVRDDLQPFLAALPPGPPLTPPPPSPSPRNSVILVYHKFVDKDRPAGMDIRMSQIVSSLVALRHTVHFVCHCNVHASQLSPFEAHVVIYGGSMREQFEQAVSSSGSSPHAVLIFFTTLTMTVHQRMLQGEADWYAEPTAQLPEEQVLSWVRAKPRIKACTLAVADDIHYMRAAEVMGRHDAEKANIASEWIRRRELGFHAAVDGTATVSLEDAAALKAALEQRSTSEHTVSGKCSSGCECSMIWIPYVQMTKAEDAIEPFGRRHEGMLYVGGMHGLAIIAIEWLLEKVQPLLGKRAARGAAELQMGGKGHLHLAGPGWAQHATESRVLNQSVADGRVTILGTLSDLQLDQRLREHKVFVAPVLNGTGIATKNVLAMAHGIPLVTTVTGLNGLGLPQDQRAILVADSPSLFAHHVLNVQSSERVFDATWRAALTHTRNYLSAERQRIQLCSLIGCEPNRAIVEQPTDSGRPLCDASRQGRQLLRRPTGQVPPLAPRIHTKPPILAIGAHDVAGGAGLIGKVLSEACRDYFAPRLGWKCATREGYDNCDPEQVDVCFHRQARFSAGRFADGGYRFVHVVRSPMDVLTRSYLLLEPNATHLMNSSELTLALEAHWKLLSNGALHEMQDIAESHASDPHALQIELEDLIAEERANATLGRAFAFLLDCHPEDERVHQLLGGASKVLLAAGRVELQGENQRKHLAKLLLRKPAKCQHVNKIQQALRYDPLPCSAEDTKTGGVGGERHQQRHQQRRWRRLLEVEPPRWHPRSRLGRRLAPAWV